MKKVIAGSIIGLILFAFSLKVSGYIAANEGFITAVKWALEGNTTETVKGI